MNLVSLDDVTTYLNISGTSHDLVLTDFINEVEAEVATFCNQNIHSTLETTYFDGDNCFEFLPPKQPISSVNAITYRDEFLINGTSSTVANTNYEVRQRDGVGYIYNDLSFIKGYYYTIGYNYGYATIPLDVKKTIIEMAATMFKESSRGGGKLNVSSETQNYPTGVSGSTSYKDLWEKKWKQALKKYRKIPI